jgi:LacI family transcriptional regulator
MEIVRSTGLSIPGDVSLVGFDDPAAAAMLDPPLTTVRQPLGEMAARACRLLRKAIMDGQTRMGSCTLETEMVVRGSTAAVK